MADKAKNQIIVIEPSTPSVTELLKLVREKDLAEITTCATPEEAIQNISGSLPCLLITSLTDNAVVPLRVQLLKRLEGVIKQGALKVYMVTGMKNRQLADLFTQKLGVTDYIIDPVPARTMFFKVNLAIKAVDNFRKIAEQKKAAQEQIVIKKVEAKKGDAAADAKQVSAKGKPALQMAEDTFLFKNGGVKKAGKKFVVEVEGPDPSTGEWKQHEDKGDAQTSWRWVPNEEKAAQEAGKAPPDGWVHSGDKPAFNEETGKWALSSEKPQLSLRKAGKVVAEKVSLDEKGEVVVAEDSPAAEANVQKNREKAAAAIKAREDSRKASLTLKAQENKAQDKEQKKPESKGEEAKKTADPAKDKPALALKDPKKEAKGQPKAKLSLADQLGGDDDSGEESGWQEEKGDFNNKTGGPKTAEPRAVQDKREHSGAALKPGAGPEMAPGKEESEAPARPKSALDFLKQKKEKLEKAGGKAAPEADDLYAEGLDQQDASGKPGAAAPAAGAEKKKRAASPIDKLARLKASLAGEGDEEEGEGWQEDKGEFNNKTGGQKTAEPRAVQDKREGQSEEFGAALKPDAGLKLAAGENGAKAAGKKVSPQLALKKKAMEQLQAKLDEPVPEEMNAAEEDAARKSLGLQNRPDIKVKELAKRKRAAEMARMKALVAEIEEEERRAEEESSGEMISNGPRSGEEKNGAGPNAHDLSAEKLKGIRAAIDGGELDGFGEESEERRRARGEKKEPKGKSMVGDDKASYMPEAELLPKGNAWESAGGWYVYLNAETRYKGFNQIADLLPLWVFQGERVPELLGKTKQWRFFGGLPVQAKTPAEVPAEVRDYLLGIRDTLASNAPVNKEREESEGPAARKEKKKDKEADLLSKLKDRLGESAEDEPEALNAAEENAEGEARDHAIVDEGGTSGLEKAGRGRNALDALKAELESEGEAGDEPDAAPADAPSSAAEGPAGKPRKDTGAAGLDALKRLKDRMTPVPDAESSEAAPPKEEKAPEREVDPSEYFGRPIKKEERADKSRSALDRLREKLGEDEKFEAEEVEEPAAEGSEESKKELVEEIQGLAKEQAQFGGDRNEAMRRLREKLLDNQAEADAPDTIPESSAKDDADSQNKSAVPELSKEQSEGVRRFLERRRAKLRNLEKTAQAARPGGPPISVYLGLFVAVSDALGLDRVSSSVPRVLQGFEDSFGNCRAYVVENPGEKGMAKVSYFAGETAPAEDHVKLDSGIAEAIRRGDGGGMEVVGYLLLRPSGDRKEFSESELQAMKKVAAMLWPILARAPGAEKKTA